MVGVEHVVSVHDLHAWTITSGMVSLSAHVIVEPDPYTGGSGSAILEALDACLLECFDIQHTTFQLESQDHFESEDPLHP
jgi:cobalt-zinc-cadmium efflux system protein